jgi:hypothetical protein
MDIGRKRGIAFGKVLRGGELDPSEDGYGVCRFSVVLRHCQFRKRVMAGDRWTSDFELRP